MLQTAVLIPAYNEAETIREIVQSAREEVACVIVIDDGSTDGTPDLLSDLDVTIIRHEQNAGKGWRLFEGLEFAFRKGIDQVITIDADGQHDPSDIRKFLEAAARNPGALILGCRASQMDRIPRIRARAIRFGNFFISWGCIRQIKDAQCGMRLYPKKVFEDVHVPSNQIGRFLFETAILLNSAQVGIPFSEVEIDARYEGFIKRPSYFRPVRDFLKLFSLVAMFIIRRRLQLRGLLVAFSLENATKQYPNPRIT